MMRLPHTSDDTAKAVQVVRGFSTAWKGVCTCGDESDRTTEVLAKDWAETHPTRAMRCAS